MDFNERVIPNVSANFLYQEALARYVFASKYIKKGNSVLDLGCGTGYGSYYLSKKAIVTGIDIDREAISYAKKYYGKKVKFLQGDITKTLGIKDKFDIVCSFEVIEHLKKPEAYLSNINLLLQPKGVCIFSTPNISVFSPNGVPKSKYHVKEFTKEELENLLKKYFKTVSFFAQTKNKKAQKAFDDFMQSQVKRQSFVDMDKFNIRKIVPKFIKEKMWKQVGAIYGRQSQEHLTVFDFPISKKNVKNAEYFIVVCKNIWK